ncbi:protein tyrosine phosphatase receptor type C-associated protein [Ornithorhynchus anatinus]|nr:protein tyrosine phosphatase receptor type C-associated protein [Ornithorhynchus anatinus]
MAVPWLLRLVPLLTLPQVLASGAETISTSTVVLLLVLLLLLLLGLALAWRRLSRDSEGRYHPTRLGTTALHRACRLAGTVLDRVWRRGRSRRGLPGSEELGEGDDDDDDDEREEEEDHDDDDEAQRQPQQQEEEEEPRSQRRPEEAAGGAEEEEKETEEEDAEDDEEEEKAAGAAETDDQGDRAPAGSAGVLLSDLHAFSGSAVWGAVDGEGAGAASDQGPNVTAL